MPKQKYRQKFFLLDLLVQVQMLASICALPTDSFTYATEELLKRITGIAITDALEDKTIRSDYFAASFNDGIVPLKSHQTIIITLSSGIKIQIEKPVATIGEQILSLRNFTTDYVIRVDVESQSQINISERVVVYKIPRHLSLDLLTGRLDLIVTPSE